MYVGMCMQRQQQKDTDTLYVSTPPTTICFPVSDPTKAISAEVLEEEGGNRVFKISLHDLSLQASFPRF